MNDIIINDILEGNNKNKEFKDETIYMIQYPEGKLSVSYGIISKINSEKKYNFYHKCSTKNGSSGSPILNVNNKLIGIHKEGYNNKFNIGTFLNEPIKEFIQINYKNSNELLKGLSQKNENNNGIFIKKLNDKYNLNISNIKINRLDLREKNLGNEIFEDLNKIEFKELKQLYLYVILIIYQI